ncbi:MAG: cobalt transporter [Clostridiales bacterium]|nr:cobalt transporter [Candidatus Cacconaster stercorequi]
MHEHCHANEQSHHSREESLALLTYMIDHNSHHAEELHQLAHSIEGDAAALIHDAIVDFNLANEKLTEALQILKEE